MTANGTWPRTTVIPTVRYRDVAAAIAWLTHAFGFTAHRVVADQDGGVRYAELTFGSGMVMVAPVQESAYGRLMVQPDAVGGVETQICYLLVEDAAAHHTRAVAAGAEIVLDLDAQDGNRRGYSCRDLEGHIWSFGSYDPWARYPVPAQLAPEPARWRGRSIAAGLTVLALLAAGVAYRPAREFVARAAHLVMDRLVPAGAAAPARERVNGHAERALREAQLQLARERAAREAAERAGEEARAQLALARRSMEAAPVVAQEPPAADAAVAAQALREAEQAREELARVRAARDAADRAMRLTRERLEQERLAAVAAEQTAREAREQARIAKEAAAQAAKEASERAAKMLRYRERRERSARIQKERAAAEIAERAKAVFQ
jgi:uncharacterized glyoxalase superfamily protein PhnB